MRTAKTIVIATGGRPNEHKALPGYELCISSNEAFHLDELPKSIVIAGGGYIAVEFANVFHGLGVETTLIYRGAEILSRFDHDLRRGLHEAMVAKGIRILCHDVIEKVSKDADGLVVETKNNGTMNAGVVMLAHGRDPNTEGLGLETAGVKTDARGAVVVVDEDRHRAMRPRRVVAGLAVAGQVLVLRATDREVAEVGEVVAGVGAAAAGVVDGLHQDAGLLGAARNLLVDVLVVIG